MASTKLTRSDLERKKRDELDSIARAMGGKPSSQARKSEIVDLIMKLTGMNGTETDFATIPSRRGISDSRGISNSADTSDSTDTSNSPATSNSTATAHFGGEDDGAATDGTATDGADQTASRSRDSGPPRVFRFDPSGGDGLDGGLDNGLDDGLNDDGGLDGGETDFARSQDDSSDSASSANGSAGSSQSHSSSNQGRRNRRRNRQQSDEHSTQIIDVEGYLDLRDEGYGFLRVKGNLPTKSDVYVSVKQVKQFGLRKGDRVRGASRPSAQNEKNSALLRIDLVNDQDPELSKTRSEFGNLTPLFPDERLRLEREGDSLNMTTRIVDLLSPIGKGQRGLIVSPPKAGKTTIMKEIARSIEINNPEVVLMVLLVDERPEEVTDMRRWLHRPTSEVIASTFDRPASEHTYIVEMAIERAKRMVEEGKDVVIILDGITRLARAYNLTAAPTGRLMSGGLDAAALYPPKKFFGAARNVEEGGSLTILGTALVETGSKMDEVIFEEFKGTGNMELRLDRRSAERRIYPAIDVDASSTRHEELLFEREQLQQVWKLRRVLSGLANENDGHGAAGLELLIDRLKQFSSNDAFLSEVAQGQMRT